MKSKIATIIRISNEICKTFNIRFHLTLPFAQEWYPAYERDSMITAAYIHLSRCLTQTFLDIVLSFCDLIHNQFHIVILEYIATIIALRKSINLFEVNNPNMR